MIDCPSGGSSDSLLSGEALTKHADRLKALATPVRLHMVDLMYKEGGEICVCELMEDFDLSQPTISHHLKVLREAGLICSRKEGTYVYYRVDETAFTGLAALMDRLSAFREENEMASGTV